MNLCLDAVDSHFPSATRSSSTTQRHVSARQATHCIRWSAGMAASLSPACPPQRSGKQRARRRVFRLCQSFSPAPVSTSPLTRCEATTVFHNLRTNISSPFSCCLFFKTPHNFTQIPQLLQFDTFLATSSCKSVATVAWLTLMHSIIRHDGCVFVSILVCCCLKKWDSKLTRKQKHQAMGRTCGPIAAQIGA